MLEFISNNIGTIAICLLLAGIVALIITKMVKNKKAGKTSCGNNCGGCPNSKLCHR